MPSDITISDFTLSDPSTGEEARRHENLSTADGDEDSVFDEFQPLASRMRPRTLDEFLGQEHILGHGKPLRSAIEKNQLRSIILWGPPGVGKTTLARLICTLTDSRYEQISAVFSGVKDIREKVKIAQQNRDQLMQKTVLFVDEIHRFSKSQQDAFLPYVEDGTFVLIGATTENPSFELNNALLSRARVYVLKGLDQQATARILRRALADKRGLGRFNIQIQDEAILLLAQASDGDARRALNLLEGASDLAEEVDGLRVLDQAIIEEALQGSFRRFDKGGDQFYDQISAFHKSVRGSAPDAALYWFARMLDGGCDPLYVARRLVAIASEDIGNADPRALEIALNAWDVFERLGPAEGERAIAHATVYLASTPKSNAIELAFKAAKETVRSAGSLEVPLHLRNAPTRLMKNLGYGAEYRYAHNEENAFAAGECYFPPELKGTRFYHPTERGLEGKIKARLDLLQQWDRDSRKKRYQDK